MIIKRLCLLAMIGIMPLNAGWGSTIGRIRAFRFGQLARPLAGLMSLRLTAGSVTTDGTEGTPSAQRPIVKDGFQSFTLHRAQIPSITMALYKRKNFTESFRAMFFACIPQSTTQGDLNKLTQMTPGIHFPAKSVVDQQENLELPIDVVLEKCYLTRLVDNQQRTVGIARDCMSFRGEKVSQSRLEFLGVNDISLRKNGASILHTLPTREQTSEDGVKPVDKTPMPSAYSNHKPTLSHPCSYCQLISQGIPDINLRGVPPCSCGRNY